MPQPAGGQLSELQYAILVALENVEPTHAYGVRTEVARINKEKPTFDRINTPSIYKGLLALSNKGLVTYQKLEGDEDIEQVPGRPQRRFLFRITDEGRRSIEDYQQRLSNLMVLTQV